MITDREVMENVIRFVFCDFDNPEHQNGLCTLLNHYMSDPMGNHPPLNPQEQLRLIHDLKEHPTAEVLFITFNHRYVGMVTLFTNYSTFYLKPYLYIHDVVILNDLRGEGLGRALLNQVIEIAEQRGYCKLTLEVREDNAAAKQLYNKLGFKESEPIMHFWTKSL